MVHVAKQGVKVQLFCVAHGGGVIYLDIVTAVASAPSVCLGLESISGVEGGLGSEQATLCVQLPSVASIRVGPWPGAIGELGGVHGGLATF